MKTIKKYIDGGVIGGVAQAGLGTAQMIYGMVENSKAKKEINKIKAAAPSLATPAEYYNAVKQAYDQRLMEVQMNELNRSLATTTDALAGAGGRALVGGINEATRGAAVQRNILAETQNQRQAEALNRLAGARENEVMRRENRYQTDLDNAWQNKQDAMAQIAGGANAMATGAMYAGLSATDTPRTATTQAAASTQIPNTGNLAERQAAFYEQHKYKDQPLRINKEGGMITDGEFSHESNPIMLVQGGKVVGEATGGEAVLNPQQQKRIAKESPYARRLLAKFKKQQKNNG